MQFGDQKMLLFANVSNRCPFAEQQFFRLNSVALHGAALNQFRHLEARSCHDLVAAQNDTGTLRPAARRRQTL